MESLPQLNGMKVDKAVCTTPAPLRQQAAGADAGGQEENDEEDEEEENATESPSEERCHQTMVAKSKYADKAERYGLVFSTLMENKMQAIKRQSADYAGAKKKRHPLLHGGSRMSSKFIPSCVRRNSEQHESKATNGGEDVEMGLIGARVASEEGLVSDERGHFDEDEVSSPRTKAPSYMLSDNMSLQSINSIGTAFSLPITVAQTPPKPLSDARLRMLEAKSVSAQASPVLPRMISHPAPSSSQPPSIDPKKLTRPPAPSVACPIIIPENVVNARSLVPSVFHHRSSAATASALVPTSSSHGGFISSFNELTSSNNLSNLININLPVITSTISHHAKNKKKTAAATAASSSSSKPSPGSTGRHNSQSATLEYEQRTDRKWPYASAADMLVPAGDSGSVGSGRQEWKASRRKHRKYFLVKSI